MPFTLAHPAAVLPLRKRLLFSALVIGAMAPDFHYFLGLHLNSKISHSVAGAFYLCLPVALAALWFFHRFLKMPLISLAPGWHQARLARLAVPFRFGPGRRFALVLLSLLAGIFSHLVWDSFTHNHGWMVQRFPPLRTVVLQDFWGGRPAYNLLQHASSLLGLSLLAFAYWAWTKNVSPEPAGCNLGVNSRTKLFVVGVIGTGAVSLSAVYGFEKFENTGRLAVFAAHAVISFVSLTLLGLMAFSLWWHFQFRRVADTREGCAE